MMVEYLDVPPDPASCESTEEFPEKGRIIRIEYYRNDDGNYFVRSSVLYGQGTAVLRKHFTLKRDFADKQQARDAALIAGRELIASMDVEQVG